MPLAHEDFEDNISTLLPCCIAHETHLQNTLILPRRGDFTLPASQLFLKALFLWLCLVQNAPDWPLVMTENLSGGEFVGSAGELPAFQTLTEHSQRQIYRLRSSVLSVFVLSPVAD